MSSEEKKPSEENLVFATWALVAGTFILAMATIVLAIYTYRLYNVAEKQFTSSGEDTNRALELSKKQLELSAATFKASDSSTRSLLAISNAQLEETRQYTDAYRKSNTLQTRAYMVMAGFTNYGNTNYEVHVTNVGNTPAYNVKGYITNIAAADEYEIDNSGWKSLLPELPGIDSSGPIIIGSKESLNLTDKLKTAQNGNQRNNYMVLVITYNDIFKVKHETCYYCLIAEHFVYPQHKHNFAD